MDKLEGLLRESSFDFSCYECSLHLAEEDKLRNLRDVVKFGVPCFSPLLRAWTGGSMHAGLEGRKVRQNTAPMFSGTTVLVFHRLAGKAFLENKRVRGSLFCIRSFLLVGLVVSCRHKSDGEGPLPLTKKNRAGEGLLIVSYLVLLTKFLYFLFSPLVDRPCLLVWGES